MYKQLTSTTMIRLLHVHPASEPDPLVCTLEHFDLDSDLNYEAISYVWGDSILSCSITCDSEIIAVTLSLYQALSRIRSPIQLRTVWIDGLCINQADDVEKSHQVQLMQRVFRDAHRVLVWLGPDPGCARNAFDFCRKFGQREMDVGQPQTSDIEQMSWVFYLARCPWWGRVWIIQEMALAKDILFLWGMEEVQWTHVRLAISKIRNPDALDTSCIDTWFVEPISRLSAIKDQRSYATSFMGTMRMARAFECSDSRDRIFAIIGFGRVGNRWAAADPDGRLLATAIIPDYASPVEHVYMQFAMMALRRNLAEDIFLAIQHGEQLNRWKSGDIPSWSPRWDVHLLNDFPVCPCLQKICSFDKTAADYSMSFIGSQQLSALQTSFDPITVDTLNVLSAIFDEIISLSQIICDGISAVTSNILSRFWKKNIRPAEATDKYRTLFTDFCETTTYQMSPENHIDFFRMYITSCEKKSGSSAKSVKAKAHAMLRSLDQLQLEMGETPFTSVFQKFPKADRSRTCSKRLFITRQGYVGMCPAAAQSGDRVALLWRTRCPMILRPQDDFYRIVGSSYVAALTRTKTDGVPHPLDDLISGTLQPEIIQIR
ncbi:hypothetical protein G6011_04104 [Alternaria panax]|uniref:Heterokaryon incompatibility domain-containing protein n=1 Tax=Alternaria panax TaxID=48097 RepID=A0AAD4IGH6_9PLEO|nr:hypothetical protein G6011_04104 [Alternaria panax]